MNYSPEANFPFLVYSKEFQEQKKKSNIMIFGSYDNRSIKRLREFRDRIKIEFKSTNLVENMQYPKRKIGQTHASHIYQKSLYWVEKSDILIWAYYIDSDKSGESMEMGAMPFLKEKYSQIIVVRETYKIGVEPPMTRLLRGLLETHREIKTVDFELNTDNRMAEKVRGVLRGMVNQ